MSNLIISHAEVPLITTVEVMDENLRSMQIQIPAETQLALYLNGQKLVTLMTMGGHPEALAIGYLRNQRLIGSIGEIASVQVDWGRGVASVVTQSAVEDIEQRIENKIIATGCALGTMLGSGIDEIGEVIVPSNVLLEQLAIYRIVETVRAYPSMYKQARAMHACALFSLQGELIYFVEDISRHNAVDQIAGKMWLDGRSGESMVFYTTARLTSEMVLKGAQMGITFMISRSGITEMGFSIATQVGLTLIGRCKGRQFLIFSGKERIVFNAVA
jgi:FdhD protein